MKIVSGAFAHSGKICTVVFPECLNSIDSLAFYRCGGLQKSFCLNIFIIWDLVLSLNAAACSKW